MRSEFRYLDEPTLFTSTTKLVARLREHPERKEDLVGDDRTGVRFRIRQRAKFITFTVGAFAEGREQVCDDFAWEKRERLAIHPEHWTSAQSADKALQRYKGAIRTPDSVRDIAVSGFKSDDDELLALGLAVDVKWMELSRALWIAKDLSENPYHHVLEDILRG